MIDREALEARALFLRTIRDWMHREGFLEVETPTLFGAPGLNPHIAELDTRYRELRRERRLWLRTSPEVFHKRLLAAGVPRLYELGRFFRNGEHGPLHNPEFTGLEFYEAGHDYRRIMERTEAVLSAAMRAVAGKDRLGEVSLALPWGRMSVAEAFQRYAGVPLAFERDALAGAAEKIGIAVRADDAYDDVFFRILLEKVERRLGEKAPVFLYDYPASMGVMARKKPGDPRFAERVELYIGGVELANGFSELTDPAEQRARLVADRKVVAAKEGMAEDSLPLDEGFLAALARMPPSTGIAIGLDRVLMLALGKRELSEVLAFPFEPPG